MNGLRTPAVNPVTTPMFVSSDDGWNPWTFLSQSSTIVPSSSKHPASPDAKYNMVVRRYTLEPSIRPRPAEVCAFIHPKKLRNRIFYRYHSFSSSDTQRTNANPSAILLPPKPVHHFFLSSAMLPMCKRMQYSLLYYISNLQLATQPLAGTGNCTNVCSCGSMAQCVQ